MHCLKDFKAQRKDQLDVEQRRLLQQQNGGTASSQTQGSHNMVVNEMLLSAGIDIEFDSTLIHALRVHKIGMVFGVVLRFKLQNSLSDIY